MKLRFHVLSWSLRVLIWLLVGLIVSVLVALYMLERGLPGKWLAGGYLAEIPADVCVVQVERVGFSLRNGIVVRGLQVFVPGRSDPFVRCKSAQIDIELFSFDGFVERIRGVTLDELYVAQLIHTSADADLHEVPKPFPDLSDFPVPKFRRIPVSLIQPSILDISAVRATTELYTSPEGVLVADKAYALITASSNGGFAEEARGHLALDIRKGILDVEIIGDILQHRINGVYAALNLPIVTEYSDKFNLRRPAWGHCRFRVGLDKRRNIFDMTIDVKARGGSYCGVPFDAAEGRIACKNVNPCVTTIGPVTVHRGDQVALTGSLKFDCGTDRFTFDAHNHLLSGMECLRIIDMPFTEVIPEMESEQPPEVIMAGALPLLTQQSPGRVVLKGSVTSTSAGRFAGFPFERATCDLTMTNGTLTLTSPQVVPAGGGTIAGRATFTIPDVLDPQYVDFAADATLKKVQLATFLKFAGHAPTESETHGMTILTGTSSIAGRTDDNLLFSLTGAGKITADGETLMRLKLFGGLTDALAEFVPGIKLLSDSSRANVTYSLTNGVVNVSRFELMGSLVNIEGDGTYTFARRAPAKETDHDLNFKILVGVFREETLMGTLTRWATVRMGKLLMDFRLTGTLDEPAWHREGVIRKIWDLLKTDSEEKEE